MTRQAKYVYAIKEGCTNRKWGNCDLNNVYLNHQCYFTNLKEVMKIYTARNKLNFQKSQRWCNSWINIQLVKIPIIDGELSSENEEILKENWVNLN